MVKPKTNPIQKPGTTMWQLYWECIKMDKTDTKICFEVGLFRFQHNINMFILPIRKHV